MPSNDMSEKPNQTSHLNNKSGYVVGSFSPLFTMFYTSQRWFFGISEPSTVFGGMAMTNPKQCIFKGRKSLKNY